MSVLKPTHIHTRRNPYPLPTCVYPSKRAQERQKRPINEEYIAHFNEFHEISYISVISGPKPCSRARFEGHGCYANCYLDLYQLGSPNP